MKTVKITLIVFLLSFVPAINAQTFILKGKVLDGIEPLPGAMVSLKGSSKITATNFKGEFYIQAKMGEQLIISYVGYLTENRNINTQDFISIKMKDNSSSYGICELTEIVKEEKDE
jgi:TonB-dependent starch-binding outer membrane protein SusC